MVSSILFPFQAPRIFCIFVLYCLDILKFFSPIFLLFYLLIYNLSLFHFKLLTYKTSSHIRLISSMHRGFYDKVHYSLPPVNHRFSTLVFQCGVRLCIWEKWRKRLCCCARLRCYAFCEMPDLFTYSAAWNLKWCVKKIIPMGQLKTSKVCQENIPHTTPELSPFGYCYILVSLQHLLPLFPVLGWQQWNPVCCSFALNSNIVFWEALCVTSLPVLSHWHWKVSFFFYW